MFENDFSFYYFFVKAETNVDKPVLVKEITSLRTFAVW